MGRILSNQASLAYSIEASLGVLAGTPTWKLIEPNAINAFGADVTTTARDPMSSSRQRRKGTVIDLDSGAEFEADLTLEHVQDFTEGLVFASTNGGVQVEAGANFDTLAATGTGYSHAALTAALAEGTLIFGRGFTTAVNNGLDVVTSGSTTTATPTLGGAQTAETPAEATGAKLEVAGVRGASADITWTFATNTLGSTALDFTTLDLTVGQMIHIGGQASTNQFAEGNAWARIVSIAATAIVVDKVQDIDSGTLSTSNGTATAKLIDLIFGQFIRNVSATDSDFLERSYQIQLTEPNGGAAAATLYEYSLGNQVNSASFVLPETDKATVTFSFVGLDTEVPTETVKTNGAAPIQPNATGAFNTVGGLGSLRLTGSSDLGACFKSLTVTVNNSVSPEKCLGTLGASYLNSGNFEVNLEAEMLFTEAALITAIRNNETVTLDFILTNDDGGFAVDVPSLTLAGGGRSFPRNESVKVSLTGEAFADDTLDTSIGISTFPYLPASTIN